MALVQGPTTVSSTEVTVVTAPTSSSRSINLKSIRVKNGEGGVRSVTFRDGTAGTTIFVIPAQATGVAGIVFADDNDEIGRILTAGNNLTAQADVASTLLTVEVEFGRL